MSKHRKRKFSGKNFIILPFIFCILTYLIIFLVASPVISAFISTTNLLFSDNKVNFSTDYNNIFVPLGENGFNTEGSNGNFSGETVALSGITFPKYSEQFGEIYIEDCSVDAKLFFGDGNIALRNGVGVFNGSAIPGYGRTVLIAGHNNTYFNGLKYAEEGQLVRIATSYGNYTYEITSTEIKKATDSSAYDLSLNEENLVMYTCYPFDALGLTPNRFFVYAKFVSGPLIDKNA